jgi:hypothetical protein
MTLTSAGCATDVPIRPPRRWMAWTTSSDQLGLDAAVGSGKIDDGRDMMRAAQPNADPATGFCIPEEGTDTASVSARPSFRRPGGPTRHEYAELEV